VFASKTEWCLLTPTAASAREGNEGNKGRHGDGRRKGGTSLKQNRGAKGLCYYDQTSAKFFPISRWR